MKTLKLIGIALLFLLIGAIFFIGRPLLSVLNGYAAKNMCSCLFVANIPEDTVRKIDLAFFPMNFADPKVDYENKVVISDFLGMKKTAVFREGLGCTLINNISIEEASRSILDLTGLPYTDSLANWFEYIDTVEYLNTEQLQRIEDVLKETLAEPDPGKPLNTRAVVVLHKGQLVGEIYKEGFNKNSKLLGWSMTKGLTATMAGIIHGKGKLNLNDNLPIPQWEGTPKSSLTYKDLLQMSSGLKWTEFYFGSTDITRMLFNSDDMGLMASQAKYGKKPGEEWLYSSGTTNIISYALRNYFSSHNSYLEFPYRELFYKIGMYSMIMEPDASGTFVGSSYSWATARDWAKIGQLYLNNGKWGNVQIVPEDWISFVRTTAPASEGRYGGHFWLNRSNRFPDLPQDAYLFDGFHSQSVIIVPSQELVVVRLGVTYADNFDLNGLVKKILEITN